MSQVGLTPRGRAALAGTLALAFGAGAAQAQSVSPEDFARLKAQVDRQAAQITAQQQEIDQLRGERDEVLAELRAGSAGGEAMQTAGGDQPGGGAPPAQEPGPAPAAPGAPIQPVGEKPAEAPPPVVASIPPELGVLTPRGVLIVDPSLEYDRTSTNRLVFRGVEIVPGINLGEVEASTVASDTGVATLALRYGVTSRLEVEARVPYVYRYDAFTTVAALNNQFQEFRSIRGDGLGDVELDGRYQLNYGQHGWPIFVAVTRVKSDTGTGPYDVPYDSGAVALELPRGSGFWGAEGGLTMLYLSDPALIFGSLTYLHSFNKDVNKTFGAGDAALHVGRVEPGDSIGASIGFGLSLNPRFSVSLGYDHNYIFKTTAFENSPGKSPAPTASRPLQVGSMLMGLSFRLTPRITIINSYQFGVTSDAPDLQVAIRVPYRF